MQQHHVMLASNQLLRPSQQYALPIPANIPNQHIQFAAYITLATSLWACNFDVASHHTTILLLMKKERECTKIKTHEHLVCSGLQWVLWATKSVFVTYTCCHRAEQMASHFSDNLLKKILLEEKRNLSLADKESDSLCYIRD